MLSLSVKQETIQLLALASHSQPECMFFANHSPNLTRTPSVTATLWQQHAVLVFLRCGALVLEVSFPLNLLVMQRHKREGYFCC